jgi:hypothetical protein
MSQEKAKILEMIQEGKITAAEGLELLKALDEADLAPARPAGRGPERFLRLRVDGDRAKVNVNIPLSLIKITSKFMGFGLKFIPEEAQREMDQRGIDLSQIDFEELVDLIEQGLVDGKLLDVDVDDPQEGKTKVEVYVD